MANDLVPFKRYIVGKSSWSGMCCMQAIEGFIWEEWVIDKLDWKHDVGPEEVETVFFNPPYKVRRTKADKSLLYGRSEEGRYLFIDCICLGGQRGKSHFSQKYDRN